jgi:hypothetical protein
MCSSTICRIRRTVTPSSPAGQSLSERTLSVWGFILAVLGAGNGSVLIQAKTNGVTRAGLLFSGQIS